MVNSMKGTHSNSSNFYKTKVENGQKEKRRLGRIQEKWRKRIIWSNLKQLVINWREKKRLKF
jgi:hypothetical protein